MSMGPACRNVARTVNGVYVPYCVPFQAPGFSLRADKLRVGGGEDYAFTRARVAGTTDTAGADFERAFTASGRPARGQELTEFYADESPTLMEELRQAPGRLALVEDGEPRDGIQAVANALGVSPLPVGRTVTGAVHMPPASDLSAAAIIGLIGDSCILDDLGVLFEPVLRLDPVALLRELARRAPRIARWPGQLHGSVAMYSRPDRRDYFEQTLRDVIVLRPQTRRFPDDPLFLIERIP